MKNKLILSLITVIFAVFFVAGCGTPPVTTTTASVEFQNWAQFGESVLIPAKDFETVGLVFTEVSFTADKSIDGQTFSYRDLLKKANDLGADAIINVVMDKKTDRIREGTKVSRKETWYGTALAIKYTEVLKAKEKVEYMGLTKNSVRNYDISSGMTLTKEEE